MSECGKKGFAICLYLLVFGRKKWLTERETERDKKKILIKDDFDVECTQSCTFSDSQSATMFL